MTSRCVQCEYFVSCHTTVRHNLDIGMVFDMMSRGRYLQTRRRSETKSGNYVRDFITKCYVKNKSFIVSSDPAAFYLETSSRFCRL
jgi:hypothetical protein